jgi:uncharacterized metal-binding protein YceD (DUF177 family)
MLRSLYARGRIGRRSKTGMPLISIINMNSLESLKIDLKSLDEGEMKAECLLDDGFFLAADSDEVKSGKVQLSISARKSVSGLYEIDFHAEGTVKVPCDLCLDDMDQPICTDNRLLAKLGEEYSDDDEIVTVDKDDAILDTSWFVYESIALDIPIKHVHAPGKCNPAMIKALEEHSAARSSEEEDTQAMDPRWSELEKLKSIIKD